MQGSVDILTEQDTLAIGVDQEHNRSRRMSGCVDHLHLSGTHHDFIAFAGKLDIHRQRVHRLAVPTGGREDAAALLQRRGVQFVGDDLATKMPAQVVGPTCVIEVAVSKQQVVHLTGRDTPKGDVFGQSFTMAAAARIDYGGPPIDTQQVNGSILR